MTGFNKEVLEEKAAEAIVAMQLSIADIDVREGTLIEAVVSNVHEANIQVDSVVGVGYLAPSDEETWYADREKALKHFKQQSVADLMQELKHPKARLVVKRYLSEQASLHDRIADVGRHLREQGATKLIVFVNSNRVLAKPKDDTVMLAVEHLGQIWHFGYTKAPVDGSFGFKLTVTDYSSEEPKLISFEYKPLYKGSELPDNSTVIELATGQRFVLIGMDIARYHSPEGDEERRLAFDLLFMLLKHENALKSGIGGTVDFHLTSGEVVATEQLPLALENRQSLEHSFLSKLLNDRFKLRNAV